MTSTTTFDGESARRRLSSAIIVEDDERLSAALVGFCEDRGINPFPVRSVETAKAALANMVFDLALVDVRLPDGSGVDVCRRLAALRPRPVIVAMSGAASAREGFLLARAGVGEFVEKPFTDEELWDAVQTNAGVPLEIVVPHLIGQVSLKKANRALRSEMVGEAIARSENASQAARLLGVTRQAVQQAVGAQTAGTGRDDDD